MKIPIHNIQQIILVCSKLCQLTPTHERYRLRLYGIRGGLFH